MKFRDSLSMENIASGLKSIGKLRPKIDHNSLLTISALSLILFIAFTIRIFPMRWEIEKASMHLSEFDPYFQYRFTEYILKNGFTSWNWPTQWVDTQRWYPDGINVARAGYIGLPLTMASFYTMISALGIHIELMDLCAIFPAIMGMLASFVIYFLGKDMGGKPVGLLASLLLALSPSYIQRTSVGFFDDETIGIVALTLFAFLFLRAIERDRPLDSALKYSLAAGLALGYFCSGWGAALYPIGVAVLFVLLLVLLRRYTQRLLMSYGLTFGLGLSIAINVPRLSSAYLTNTAILAVAGVFLLLCLSEVLRALQSAKWKVIFFVILLALVISGFTVFWQLGYMRGITGKFLSVVNPVVRADIPLSESVAEHRISAWGPMYYDLGIVIVFFIAGFFFLLRDLNDKNLFLLVLGLTSLYFACSMVRLLVLMAPAFSVLASVGIAGILSPFSTLLKESVPRPSMKKKYGLQPVGREFSGGAILLIFLVLMTNFAFPMPKVYRQAWSPVTITASSLPIAPSEPVWEWLDMLQWTKNNLEATTVVCSWWDYGYWLTVLGNVTSLADNATKNKTQIQNIGFILMSNETQALKMLELYDAKYVLVFTTFDVNGNWIGYGDEGKWMWMARISGKAKDRFIADGFIDDASAWTDESIFGNYNSTTGRWDWNATGMKSNIYKLMAWGKHRWCEGKTSDPEQQQWSKYNVTAEDIQPEYFKEAYFAGVDLSVDYARSKYGGIVPLVCLYEIDWQKYHREPIS